MKMIMNLLPFIFLAIRTYNVDERRGYADILL